MSNCKESEGIARAAQTLRTGVSPVAVSPTCELLGTEWTEASRNEIIFGTEVTNYSCGTGDAPATRGDFFVDTDDGNTVYQCDGSNWTRTTRNVYRQTGTPTTAQIRDIWFDTDDNQLLTLTAQGWEAIGERNQYFSQPSEPTGPGVSEGDIWYDSDDYYLKLYHNGSWTTNADFMEYVADRLSHEGPSLSYIQSNWPCDKDTLGHIAEVSDTDDFYRCTAKDTTTEWTLVADTTRYHANDMIKTGTSTTQYSCTSSEEGWIFFDTNDNDFYQCDGKSWKKRGDITKYFAHDITFETNDYDTFTANTNCIANREGWILNVEGDIYAKDGIYRCNGSMWNFIAPGKWEGLPDTPGRPEDEATNNQFTAVTSLPASGCFDGQIAVLPPGSYETKPEFYIWNVDQNAWCRTSWENIRNDDRAPDDYADVTGDHANDIVFIGATSPAHKVGRLWYDTNVSVLKRSDGTSWTETSDKTSEHADTIIYKGSTAPAHKAGRVWYDTGTSEFKRSDGTSWTKVSDITSVWETFSTEGDIDVLLTTNAPKEANADETIGHSDDIIYYGATAPSHQAGRLWFDTDVNQFKRSDGSAWSVVGDETALKETFSTEGDIDVLLTTNAPAEAAADVTGEHADNIIFIGGTAPPHKAGRLWYDTNVSVFKRSDGASWTETADKTSEHPDTIIYKQSTAPSHQDGRLWFDTSTDVLKRSDGTSWIDVTDISSVFAVEGDIDVLNTTHAPKEANADETVNHSDEIIYKQSAAPPHKAGRLWFDTDTSEFKRSDGASWSKVSDITSVFETFSDEADIDVLQTTNAPSEAGADITGEHPADIIYYGTSAPSHKAGRLWFDSSVDQFKRSDGSAWNVVGDETALKETFSTEGDIDVLLTTNAPAEANADETIGHADDIIYKGSTSPGHKKGRLWFDTSVNQFKRSDGASWTIVGDETALKETFSTEGDIDVLLTTNAPAEANADVTKKQNQDWKWIDDKNATALTIGKGDVQGYVSWNIRDSIGYSGSEVTMAPARDEEVSLGIPNALYAVYAKRLNVSQRVWTPKINFSSSINFPSGVTTPTGISTATDATLKIPVGQNRYQ